MKKTVVLTIFLLIVLMATNVFAVSTTMEIVEDNVCTIKLNDNATFEKKIVESDLTNHEVTLQLKISNDSTISIPTGELMLVIDSSSSMDTVVSDTTTRKDLVLNSANSLVESLLAINNSSLKIGVVTFSTTSEKNDEGYLDTGTIADAQKVCDFTNNVTELQSKISAIEGTGQYTNLDAGLQLAKQSFTSEDNNKYMIVLTDGLPNLAVGYDDLVTYEGLTDVINQTKSTLNSLDGINVITMLTGIDNGEAIFRPGTDASYTYGQVIQEVFGSEENPTIGKFYNIDDSEIEKTITEDIFNDLVPIISYLKDISITDFFPQYIVDNFDITYIDGIDFDNVTGEIDEETNSFTIHLKELGPNDTITLRYKLTLKDEFDEEIIGEILDTNEKVDITYTDFDGSEKSQTSDVTPKIKLTAVEDPTPEPEPQPEPEPEPEPEPQPEPEPEPQPEPDPTVSEDPLPFTGSHMFILGFVIIGTATGFFAYKSRKIR